MMDIATIRENFVADEGNLTHMDAYANRMHKEIGVLLVQRGMTDEQIKHMVDRFLGWRLPENFQPDAGISFKAEYNVEYNAAHGKPPARRHPSGTNLFDATQAEAMIRYMVEGMPGNEVR